LHHNTNLFSVSITWFIENAPNVLQQLNLPLKRNNVDKGKNPYGNLLLNLCRGNDLFIVNGRIGELSKRLP
jgi:hypothetical protein